ncbi:MAG: hypothetical protein KDB23_27460, partial [Planctomycetales bacterium]|nr:hypothetical protein [Planctomycetales bacterium]
GLAPDASHELIASCLVKQTPPVQCPPWGGHKSPQSDALRLILLPPMHPTDVDRMETEVSKVDATVKVGCVDSAKLACVCDLQIVKPMDHERIFTSYFTPYLEEAKQNPALHFVNWKEGAES